MKPFQRLYGHQEKNEKVKTSLYTSVNEVLLISPTLLYVVRLVKGFEMEWKKTLKVGRMSEYIMHPCEKHLALCAPRECCLRDGVKV